MDSDRTKAPSIQTRILKGGVSVIALPAVVLIVAVCALTAQALRAGHVREALLHNLAQPMTLDTVSRRLKIPIRTLRRRLQQEGTSYRKLADELRTEIAIKYLRDTAMTVEDIASSLGFSDAASFRYAFRRWTNATPGKFRRDTGS